MKELMKKLIVELVFPAVDKFVADWKVPFQIDDKIWANLKQKILEKLDAAHIRDDHRGVVWVNDVGAFNVKDAVKNFIIHDVFPAIDSLTQKWHTPFELDDLAWKALKAKIEEVLA